MRHLLWIAAFAALVGCRPPRTISAPELSGDEVALVVFEGTETQVYLMRADSAFAPNLEAAGTERVFFLAYEGLEAVGLELKEGTSRPVAIDARGRPIPTPARAFARRFSGGGDWDDLTSIDELADLRIECKAGAASAAGCVDDPRVEPPDIPDIPGRVVVAAPECPFGREDGACVFPTPEACDVTLRWDVERSECVRYAPCPGTEWPAQLPGAVTYVRDRATNGDGSMGAPYGDVGTALQAANVAPTIALADGTYVVDVTLDGRTLVGSCASRVTLQGNIAVDGSSTIEGVQLQADVDARAGASLTMFRVELLSVDVEVRDTASLDVAESVFVDSQFDVTGAAAFDRTVFLGTALAPPLVIAGTATLEGVGFLDPTAIDVRAGGRATLEGVAIASPTSPPTPIVTAGAGSELSLNRVSITSSRPALRLDGARATLRTVAIEGASRALDLTGSTLDASDIDLAAQRGVDAMDSTIGLARARFVGGIMLSAQRGTFTSTSVDADVASEGVSVDGGDVSLSDVRVRSTVAVNPTVVVEGASRLHFEGLEIEAPTSTLLRASASGSATVNGLVAVSTAHQSGTTHIGMTAPTIDVHGVQVMGGEGTALDLEGGRVTLHDVSIEDVANVGGNSRTVVLRTLQGAVDPAAEVQRLVIRGNQTQGGGVRIVSGHIDLFDADIDIVGGVGVDVDATSDTVIQRLEVKQTAPGDLSRGLLTRGAVSMEDVALEGSSAEGIGFLADRASTIRIAAATASGWGSSFAFTGEPEISIEAPFVASDAVCGYCAPKMFELPVSGFRADADSLICRHDLDPDDEGDECRLQ
ncbi:MAG: hypothetical protein RIT81_24760 [Deltaproteobacteria bacterium]